MAFATQDDMGMFEARPWQAEVEQHVRQGLPIDHDPEGRQVGEVRKPHPAGLMDLPEDDVLLGTMLSAPRPDPPFQRAPDSGGKFRVAAQNLLEDRHGTKPRRFLQKRHDLGVKNRLERVRPPPFTRLRLLRWEPRVLCDAIARGTADIRLRGGHLDRVGLSELHEKPHLLIGYVSTRHKGGSPFQKTPSLPARPQTQTPIRGARGGGTVPTVGLRPPSVTAPPPRLIQIDAESHPVCRAADVPPGSGLGSSSTVVVAVITALSEYCRLALGEYEIAHLAYEVERLDLGLSGGKQDQYAATFGGFNLMEFYAGDRVIINLLRLRSAAICELEASLVLYFSGRSGASASIIDEQVSNVLKGQSKSIEAMHQMKLQASQMKEALLLGNFVAFGEVLRSGWQSKRAMATNISNDEIDRVLEAAITAGAHGGKISGAGGGGFMMISVPPERKPNVIEALSAFPGKVVNFVFTNDGARAWKVS